MIYANPTNGNACQGENIPAAYSLSFDTAAEYEAWRDENFPPKPASDPVDQVPEEVTRKQLLIALYLKKQFTESDLETRLKAALPESEQYVALLHFRSSLTFQFAHPMVAVFKQILEMTDAETEDIFRHAALIQ